MKIKLVIQVVLCMLLGVVARAEGPQFKRQSKAIIDHTCTKLDRIMAATGYQDDNDSFASRTPVHRHVRHKSRFRVVAPYTVTAGQSGSSSRCFDRHELTVPLPGSNAAHLLPFYYIFLFRFTPF
ncbi:hypothetical protein [Paraflavitalea pollutisoli]|uniref:hypothetical protein n=1 Tax=Paraflavitalea pollutisoli TaxID=3034143 RepID=UPI0023EE128D|nr:hypothetical protein [Paraflavitalea sp. H1-2-19X]